MHTHNNKRNEIDPVPERMRILDVIHDIHPAFQTNHLITHTNQTRDNSNNTVIFA